MDFDVLDLLRFAWGLLSIPLYWCVKQINDLKKDYYETKIHAAQTYITKIDYREDIKTLHAKIDAYQAKNEIHYSKILEKLDSKVDK